MDSIYLIPNTAVFGPTKLIETTIASTARMKISAEDFGWRFLRWPDGAIRKILFIFYFFKFFLFNFFKIFFSIFFKFFFKF